MYRQTGLATLVLRKELKITRCRITDSSPHLLSHSCPIFSSEGEKHRFLAAEIENEVGREQLCWELGRHLLSHLVIMWSMNHMVARLLVVALLGLKIIGTLLH